MTKEAFRQKMYLILKSVPATFLSSYSNKVEMLFYQQDWFLKAKNFGMYSSIKDREINTETIIRQLFLHGKNVFIPIWGSGKPMHMVRIKDWEDYMTLPVDRHGIKRPIYTDKRETIMDSMNLDILVIPGVAFDSSGHRLGRGKGYYDAYISKYKEFSKQASVPLPVLVGFALPEQIFPIGDIPLDDHDQRLDCILSGDGAIYPKNG